MEPDLTFSCVRRKTAKMLRPRIDTLCASLSLSIALASFFAQGCLSEAPWPAGYPIIHPIFHVSDPARIQIDQLECSTFKSLNDRYLADDARRFYRQEIIDMEEQVLGSDRLGKLLIGHTPAEITELIGLPRITAGRIADLNSGGGDRNWLYYFGYLPIAVRVTYQSNRCISTSLCEFAEIKLIEEEALLELKKHAIGKSEDQIEDYLHHKLTPRDLLLPPPVQSSSPIHIVHEAPIEKEFVIGGDFVWTFHFTDGKCTEIHESIQLG